jgi:hypothetical protein
LYPFRIYQNVDHLQFSANTNNNINQSATVQKIAHSASRGIKADVRNADQQSLQQ